MAFTVVLLCVSELRTFGVDSAYFEQGERIVSRGELLKLIGRLAAALRAAGLGPGRGLAVSLAVSPEAFAAQTAAHVLGCRVVGVRPGYAPVQLAHVLEMDVDALLVDRSTATADLLAAAGRTPLLSLGSCPDATDLMMAAPSDNRGAEL